MFLLSKDYWEVRQTKNKGRGVFATKNISVRTIIGDYTGELVDLVNFDFDKEKENQYLMYYSDTHGIYPDLSKDDIHLLNHSCNPNCFIYSYKRHTLVFALRDIIKNEELTISYLLPPKVMCANCNHACHCESPNCTKSMHLTETKYEIWQDFLNKNESKFTQANEEEELKPLTIYPKLIPNSYILKIKNLGII